MVKLINTGQKNNYNNYVKGCFDIGKGKNYCYAESPSGKYLKVFNFENNVEGFMSCYEKLEAFRESEGLEQILLGVESTGTYGEAVTDWMMKKGINMVGVNPKHIYRMKEVIDNSPLKSDEKDPKVGTLLVKNGQFHQILQVSGVAADLRTASKYRRQLKVSEGRLLNQIESQVARIFPEYLTIMKSLGLISSIHLLKQYALPTDFVELGEEELTEILKKVSNSQLKGPRAGALIRAAEKSVGIARSSTSIKLAINDLAMQVEMIRQSIKKTEKLMKDLLVQHRESDIILSMPGIGLVTACELIGETGGLNNYSNAKKLIKMAGLNLYELSSGKHNGQRRISKRGRAGLRQILYLAALRMIKKNGIFRAQFERHIKTMKKPQALIAIAKKILTVLFAMVKKQEEFVLGFSK